MKEEEVQIYDEVTEDQYKSIVKGRLQRTDFVVDDGAEGYMDNGMDDWGASEEDEAMSEDDLEVKKKSSLFVLLRRFGVLSLIYSQEESKGRVKSQG